MRRGAEPRMGCVMTAERSRTHSGGADRPPSAINLRALAHPIRQQLLDLLAADGLRVTDCANRLGVSTAVVSHHMQILAKYGFVEVVREGVGREKFWKATGVSLPLDALRDDPETSAAVAEQMLGRMYRHLQSYVAAAVAGDLPRQWIDPGAIVELTAWLTPAELLALGQELGDVAEKWALTHPGPRRGRAKPVRIQYAAFRQVDA